MSEFNNNTGNLQYEELPFSSICTHLKNKGGDVKEDLIFAKLIVANDSEAINYFIGDYSSSLLHYIASSILHLNKIYEYGEPCNIIASDYYIFMAAPFNKIKDNIPEWHKIALYRGDNNARLYSYVSYITQNHFIKNKKKYDNRDKDSLEVLEFVEYNTLLGYDYADDEIDENSSESLQNLHKAFLCLKKRDQITLQYLVMDKMHWSEAFEDLRTYLDPKGPNGEWKSWIYEKKQKAIDEYWDAKQKQDAMAGLKKRAIAHLTSQFNKLKR